MTLTPRCFLSAGVQKTIVGFVDNSEYKFCLLIVNRLQKVLFLCALLAAVLGTSLRAGPAAGGATNAVAVAAQLAKVVPAEEPLVTQIAPPLFNVFGFLPVTNSMVCTWIVALVIVIIIRLTTWKMSEIPSGGQNVMEALIEGWEGLMGNVLEPKVVKWVFPLTMTYFIFIAISNLSDLFPGVGSIGFGHADKNSAFPLALEHVSRPFFRPPTTDANLTIAMAGIFLVMCLYWAVKYNGLIGLIKHVFGVKVEVNKWLYPLLLLLFIFIGVMEAFSILFIRPVALALRLYGNIFGGETMLTMALSQKPLWFGILVAIPGYFFETVVCLLQAFVFAMLSVAFVGTLCSPSETEHDH